MNLKERLRQIAKNKIAKTQIKSNVNSKSSAAKTRKPRVAKSSKSNNGTAYKRLPSFFPEAPIGFYVYRKPLEARFPTERERELAREFLEEAKNKQTSAVRQEKILPQQNQKIQCHSVQQK